jgi:DNA topoisomerase-1
MTRLIIVESPAKAKTFQKYLGDDYIVKACYGHTTDLNKGGKFGIGVDIENGFRPYYSISKDKFKVVDELITDAEKCSEIFLASDPDREGEAISWHLKQLLESSGKRITRISIREISKKALNEAISKPRDIDMNVFRSQEARRILDRIVGFLVSPLLIEQFGKNNSAGRVQSVASRLIIDREAEISSFKPEEFWNVFATFASSDKSEFNAKLKAKLINKSQTEKAVEGIKAAQTFVVKTVLAQKKKVNPPPPFTTITMQRYMAQKYAWSPEKTMLNAQSLYETGFCTYIRTDSIRASNESISEMRQWLKENTFDIPKKPNEYRVVDATSQDAHECIRPTNIYELPKDTKSISQDEALLYKSIWMFFACSQMNPAVWATLNITITAKNDDKIVFTTSGKTLEYKGYLDLMGGIGDNIELPNLKEGQTLLVSNIQSDQKFTRPPPRFNDDSLLKELETKQIGRPATYADILKKIIDRGYIEKQGVHYMPTELGKRIVSSLVGKFSFLEYKYSAAMEKKLDDIAEGNLDQKTMLSEFFAPLKKCLTEEYARLGHQICDKCGSHMNEKFGKDGSRFLGCASFPHCRNTHSVS